MDYLGFHYSSESVSYFLAIALGLYLLGSVFGDWLLNSHIYRLAGVSPWLYHLKGFDVGEAPRPFFVRRKFPDVTVTGCPDMVFQHRLSRRYIVMDFKNRAYSGFITPYENFQMTLYLGLIGHWSILPPKGFLLYTNGRQLVSFQRDTYRTLIRRYAPELVRYKQGRRISVPMSLTRYLKMHRNSG